MNGIYKAFHFRVVFVCFEAKHQVAGIVVEVGGVGGTNIRYWKFSNNNFVLTGSCHQWTPPSHLFVDKTKSVSISN